MNHRSGRLIFSLVIFITLSATGCSSNKPTVIPTDPSISQTNESLSATLPTKPINSTENSTQNTIKPGTYIIGTEIQPGFYSGTGGYDLIDSCYWERLKDLTGSLDSIIANSNSIGKFYIEVLGSDKALTTSCELSFLPKLPNPVTEFSQEIQSGMYLVGIDIKPGTYKGQAGEEITESCYWARLRDALDSIDSIIANDNGIGQFYVKVEPNDFAFLTDCKLERIDE